jgi:hypothetical protein
LIHPDSELHIAVFTMNDQPFKVNACGQNCPSVVIGERAAGSVEQHRQKAQPKKRIGEQGDQTQRELNYAAYVRFASHYKDFVSQEELQAEVARAQAAPRRMPRRAGANQPPLLPPTPLDAAPTQIEGGRARRVGRR